MQFYLFYLFYILALFKIYCIVQADKSVLLQLRIQTLLDHSKITTVVDNLVDCPRRQKEIFFKFGVSESEVIVRVNWYVEHHFCKNKNISTNQSGLIL